MAVIPGQQDVSTFMGGGYSTPQILNSQIPGAPNIPQIGNPINSNPQSMIAPQPNISQSAIMNAIANGIPKSGINHSYGSGGWSSGIANQTPRNNNSNMISGLFGHGSVR